MLFNNDEKTNDINLITPNRFEPVSQFILFSLVIYLGVNPPTIFVDLINNAISILN